jgi:hypothetical protein
MMREECLVLWSEHWDIETYRGCFSFEPKKYKETSQLVLAEDARDMWLSYIMMRKSKEVPF